MAKKYPGLPRYVLETDYGCYSDYGWTIANMRYSFEEGKEQFDFWSNTGAKSPGRYRLVDGETGDVLLGDDT
jgi:hypothetical protein